MCSALVVKEEIKKEVVTNEDLVRFMKLLDCKDGGPAWQNMMDKSIPGMTYQAWRREVEVTTAFLCWMLLKWLILCSNTVISVVDADLF